ncbi:MAG: hypothetical protein V2B18_20230 [Pseudomonadota bacterium]
MIIVAHISFKGTPVADVTYRSGLHVEVRVAQEFLDKEVRYPLKHSENKEFKGTWEAALDSYFNEGRFDTLGTPIPHEMRRVGLARDHKSLFRQAVVCLLKDLDIYGYKVDVEFV